MLLAVAVVLALAGGGYYEAPKLLASKKAPTLAPVAHHVATPGAAAPGAAAPSASASSATVPGAAAPSAGAATTTGGAQVGTGYTLPTTLNGMPKLTDPQSTATAAAFLKTTADAVFAFQDNSSAALYRLNPTTDVTVAASVNNDSNKDLANLDHTVGVFFLPGADGLKPAPVVGAASPAWIECKTFTNLGNGSDDADAKPATNCAYVSATVVAAIVIPSPRGADETTVAMTIGRQLH